MLRDHTLGAVLVVATIVAFLLRDAVVETAPARQQARRMLTAAAMTGFLAVLLLVTARFLVVR